MSDPMHTEILARLQKLEDIEAIKRLKYKYFRSIDSADIAALDDLLTDDISVDYKGGSYHWAVRGKDIVLQALKAGFHNRALAQHNGHHPEIDVTSSTEATGLWYLADSFIHLDTLVTTIGSALYRDTYVKIGGKWKIATSSYTRIYEMVETLEKAPNVTFSLLASTGQDPVS
jgi:hypothetical protein